MAGVSLEHVFKRYPSGFYAVRDISLTIEDGEFLILLGPSGCGKSTTLRMIAGLEEVTSGEIRIGGQRVNELPPKDRNIAMVFQNYALYPHMSVYENMAFSLRIRKEPQAAIDEKVKTAAELLGLTEVLDRMPAALSGGQRQRVAMGRAIVRRPQVFLMDEPLSNLDARLRAQVRTEIGGLQRKLKTTMIYVTHDQTEAMTLGTRIVVMKDGVIQQADTPEEIYEHPGNRFVAGFVGAPQMNMLDAVLQTNGEMKLSVGGITLPLSGERAERLKAQGLSREKLLLGIRPEHIHLLGDSSCREPSEAFSVRVQRYETLGAEAYAYFHFAGTSCCARVDPEQKLCQGAEARFCIDCRRLHGFDMDTGEALFH